MVDNYILESTVDSSNTTVIELEYPIYLVVQQIGSVLQTTFSALTDVSMGSVVDKSLPVYRASDQKIVLDSAVTTINITDGGTY